MSLRTQISCIFAYYSDVVVKYNPAVPQGLTSNAIVAESGSHGIIVGLSSTCRLGLTPMRSQILVALHNGNIAQIAPVVMKARFQKMREGSPMNSMYSATVAHRVHVNPSFSESDGLDDSWESYGL